MTPKEFKEKAQLLYNKHQGIAGELGHIEVDELLKAALCENGFEEGIQILQSMKHYWYS